MAKNEVRINKGKIKVLFLKNRNKKDEEILEVLCGLSMYDQAYFISLFNDERKKIIYHLYIEKIEAVEEPEVLKSYKHVYKDLFVVITVALYRKKYFRVKMLLDKYDLPKMKGTVSLIFTIIEYFLSDSDYEMVLRLLFALSLCHKAKKYILKQTLDYLKYITEIPDENLFKKTLKKLLQKDTYLAYRVYRAVTSNIDISFEDGITKYFGMSIEKFEELSYKTYYQSQKLILLYDLYSQIYGYDREKFYSEIDNIFEKIKKYDTNKDCDFERKGFLEKEHFLFRILGDFSKYDLYKDELFNSLKNEHFYPNMLYHEIDLLFKNAIKGKKIIELLDNMPRGPYNYDLNITNSKVYYKWYRLEYLRKNYNGITDYFKYYTPIEVIKIYMNTSLKLIIPLNEIFDYLKDFKADYDIINDELSKYYFYGRVKREHNNFYFRVSNVFNDKYIDMSDNRYINSFYDFYLENDFIVRFKYVFSKEGVKINDLNYLTITKEEEKLKIEIFNRYVDAYESVVNGEINDDTVLYLKRNKYAGYLSDLLNLYIDTIFKIDELNYKQVLLVLENDNISVFNKKNFNFNRDKVWKIVNNICDTDKLLNKWNEILKLNISSDIKFGIYINSIFKLFLKLEDVMEDLNLTEIPNKDDMFFVGYVENGEIKPYNYRSDISIKIRVPYNKIKFSINTFKNGKFEILRHQEFVGKSKKLPDLGLMIKKYADNKDLDILPSEVILTSNQLFSESHNPHYEEAVLYYDYLGRAFLANDTKEELHQFIYKIGENSIYNEKYGNDYSIYFLIKDKDNKFLDKVLSFDLTISEALYIYNNSPLKIIYFISDFLKEYYRVNRGDSSSLSLEDYNMVFDVFVSKKGDVSECIYNETNVKIKLSGDFEEGTLVSVKITNYEIFTGIIHGDVLVLDEVFDSSAIKKQFEIVLDKMKNYKLGDGTISFDYMDAYRFNLFNINDFLNVYLDVFHKNIHWINFLSMFSKNIRNFNPLIFVFEEDDNIYRSLVLKSAKYYYRKEFFFRINDRSLIDKVLFINRNSFLGISIRYLVHEYLKNIGEEKFVFSKSRVPKVSLTIESKGDYYFCRDIYHNGYNINLKGVQGLKPGNSLIVRLDEYLLKENYFNVSLISIKNMSDISIRYFSLNIDKLLKCLSGIYNDFKNIDYHLFNLVKITKRKMILSSMKDIYPLKIKEYFILYSKIFDRYAFDLKTLGKIVTALGHSSPFDVTNREEGFDEYISSDIILKFKDSFKETDSYIDALNVYYNSFLSNFISLEELRELFDLNSNEKFNEERGQSTLFVKYSYNEIRYYVSYDGRVKITLKGFSNKSPYILINLKKLKVNNNELKFEKNEVVESSELSDFEDYLK